MLECVLFLWNGSSSQFLLVEVCGITFLSFCHCVLSTSSCVFSCVVSWIKPDKARELFLSLILLSYFCCYLLLFMFEMEINCLLYQAVVVLLVCRILKLIFNKWANLDTGCTRGLPHLRTLCLIIEIKGLTVWLWMLWHVQFLLVWNV